MCLLLLKLKDPAYSTKIILTSVPLFAILLPMNKLKYPFFISRLPLEGDSDSSIKFPNLSSYPFLISILPSEEGGGYLIEFPDLPGCMSDGETIEETIENGKDAVFCWIETAKAFGDEIPQPGSANASI